MKILSVTQNTPEWAAIRSQHFCASEAPVVMGASKYMSRDQLLKAKKFGLTEEIDASKQALFDRGHEAESAMRSYIEQQLEDEFYPVTGSLELDGMPLLASFDGINMAGDTCFEHKLYSKALAAAVRADDLDPHYYWQLEHQLLVSQAMKVLFVSSDGTPDKIEQCYYQSHPGRRKQLIAGWKQFAKDLAAYQHEPEVIKPTAEPIKDLPSPTIRVDGSLALISNLDVFGEQLKGFIENINQTPEDDQEFADAEAAVKTLKKAEDALTTAENAALAQTTSIDEMRRTVAHLRDVARTCRLDMEKIVKNQKTKVKTDAVNNARIQINSHLAMLNKGLGGNYLNDHVADFPGVIHGKKTFSSIKSALNDEVARAKIATNEAAEKIRTNLKTLNDAGDYRQLFYDLNTIILKEPEDFAAIVQNRVYTYQAKENQRLANERERIRLEEEEKARRVAEEERERIRKEEEARARQNAEQVRTSQIAPAPTSIQEHPTRQEPSNELTDQADLSKAHLEFQRPAAQKPQSAKSRPTDSEIIDVLSLHYRVHESKVIEWLLNMDLHAESEKLRTAM